MKVFTLRAIYCFALRAVSTETQIAPFVTAIETGIAIRTIVLPRPAALRYENAPLEIGYLDKQQSNDLLLL